MLDLNFADPDDEREVPAADAAPDLVLKLQASWAEFENFKVGKRAHGTTAAAKTAVLKALFENVKTDLIAAGDAGQDVVTPADLKGVLKEKKSSIEAKYA